MIQDSILVAGPLGGGFERKGRIGHEDTKWIPNPDLSDSLSAKRPHPEEPP